MIEDFTLVGEHANMERATYDKIKAVRNSNLKEFVKCPERYRYAVANGSWQPTKAQKFGVMFHVYLLEPEKFNKVYHLVDESERPGKSHGMLASQNAVWLQILESEFEAKGGGIYYPEDLAQMAGMRESILSNPMAEMLINSFGYAEYAFVKPVDVEYWRWGKLHTERVMVKGLIDKFLPNVGGDRIVWDLKTAEDADPDQYPRHSWEWEYQRPAALYCDMVGADHFFHVVVEKKPPYCVWVTKFTDDLLEQGRNHPKFGYRPILGQIAKMRAEYGSEWNTETRWPMYEAKNTPLPGGGYEAFGELKKPYWI